MKVHIKSSDGTPHGTKITDENGKDIDGVTRVTWRAAVNDINRAEIELLFVDMDVQGEARMMGPRGEVRRIEYADGTVDEFPA